MYNLLLALLRRVVTGLPPRRDRLYSSDLRFRFVVDKVALVYVSFRVLRLSHQYNSPIASYSSSPEYCSYQKDKWGKLETAGIFRASRCNGQEVVSNLMFVWPCIIDTIHNSSWSNQAASSVHYTASCKHSQVSLRMGEIIARNMLSWLRLLIKLLLMHPVGCLYYSLKLFVFVLMFP